MRAGAHTPRGRGRLLAAPLVGALVVVLGGCSSSGAGAARGAATTLPPQPAGRNPSEISKMVCSAKAERELAGPLGLSATVSTPTWNDKTYACRYQYSDGHLDLSVRELSSWKETYAYFDGLQASLGDTGKLSGLGQGAFSTANGSIVVRKDWKVLLVDISGLPPQFGVPATKSSDVAFTVADVIMGCWAGD